MVKHLDLKELTRLDEHAGDVDIFRACLATRGWVVVCNDDGRTIELQGQAEQFANSHYVE